MDGHPGPLCFPASVSNADMAFMCSCASVFPLLGTCPAVELVGCVHGYSV